MRWTSGKTRSSPALGAEGLAALFCVILSAAWLLESWRLRRSPATADAGTFPLWLSLCCLAGASVWLARAVTWPGGAPFGRPSSLTIKIFACLIAYPLVLQYFGFLLTTFAFLTATMAVFKKNRWWVVLGVCAPASVAFYLVFSRWLAVGLPRSALGLP